MLNASSRDDLFAPFAEQLIKWNGTINLVQEKTVSAIFQRHIEDSLQLEAHIDFANDVVVDVGSGAGFPGMILAIAGAQNIHLVEPTAKKIVFLKHIKALYNLQVAIHESGWQEVRVPNLSVVTSRAFASLNNLLGVVKFVSRETEEVRGVFLKGAKIQTEILEAQKNWNFKFELFQSVTHADGCIVKVWEVSKK